MLNLGRTGASESGSILGRSLQAVGGLLGEILTYDGAERRKDRRFKVNWSGMLEKISSASRASIKVRVLNISEGGCCIHIDGPSSDLGDLSILCSEGRFELTLFPHEMIPRIAVEVRWYMPFGEGRYGAGLEFTSISGRNRSLLLAALRKLS